MKECSASSSASRLYLGTGAGIGYETVVGAIQTGVDDKLHPSARCRLRGATMALYFSIGARF